MRQLAKGKVTEEERKIFSKGLDDVVKSLKSMSTHPGNLHGLP